LLLFLAKGSQTKWISLALSLVCGGISVAILAGFDPLMGVQFAAEMPWLPTLGISYHVGIDGISLVLVLLTNLLCPLIVYSTFKQNPEHPGLHYGLMLIMQGAMTGVFVSLDIFLYYIFWELALIPAYFLVLLYGAFERNRIAMKFFLYTLVGSLLMLVAIIYLSQQNSPASFDIFDIYGVRLTPNAQLLVLLAFMSAYAIKIPIFPFHTWQPDTYTSASSGTTMMLSGIMLKMGLYSIIRWVLPIVPAAVTANQNWLIWIIVIGVAYASLIAIQQTDLKRLFAYASIAHVGLIAAGILTMSEGGLQGSLLQMLSHGINAVGLFYVCAILSERRGTNKISELGGIRKLAPWFATAYFVVLLGTVALPLTNGFVGEFLLLSALFKQNWVWSLVAGSGVILGAVYMFKSYQGVMLGKSTNGVFADLDNQDKAVLLPIGIAIIVFGLLPSLITHLSGPAIEQLLQQINQAIQAN
jgi:NADH-quinone oxidoreductase subunit M